MGGSDQQTQFIQSRSSASIPHNSGILFQTTVKDSYGQPEGCCVRFSSITHLLSMLLVSMEKIGSIIQKIRGAVTVTIGSQARDLANPDSDEFFEAAGTPGVYPMWGYASCRV